MRTRLKVLRTEHNLGQVEMSEKLGVSLATYNRVEKGARDGSLDFWRKLDKTFNLGGEKVWEIINEK